MRRGGDFLSSSPSPSRSKLNAVEVTDLEKEEEEILQKTAAGTAMNISPVTSSHPIFSEFNKKNTRIFF